LDQGLCVRVDLPQDAELHVVDGERQERVFGDPDQCTIAALTDTVLISCGQVVGVDQGSDSVRDVVAGGDLVDDAPEDFD
jgi:hypothetical protein